MVSIIVWSKSNIEIDGKPYYIDSDNEMIIFIESLIDKIKFSGGKINLESTTINSDEGIALYHQIKRW